ncbi:MAG: GntR family transcriptional regulator [Pseudomonadota bacterium]
MDRFDQDHTGTARIGASKSERIAHQLEDEIRRGVLARGQALESENALVRRFSVSRSTIRKSLEMLSSKGLITTKSGIGSFVTFDGRALDDSAGWTLALAQADTRLETRVLRLDRGSMDLNGYDVPHGADCMIVDRLRLSGRTGEGVSLERSRVPWRAELDDVLDAGLIDGSLSTTLRHHNLNVSSGDEWASVLSALPASDQRLMQRSSAGPMLHLRRQTRTAGGLVIEVVESLLDPDLFGLHMEFGP